MSNTTTHVRTLILGAGFGGLGMAAQLTRKGDRDFLILERQAQLGGVWRQNDYPGAACDTEAHLYCYSFFPHLRVSRMYAGRDELISYMENLSQAYDLDKNTRFNTELKSAAWDANAKLWRFVTQSGEELTAQFFIPAWGQLNQPAIPAFSGLSSYQGKSFHSAQWDHSVDLKGKRIASVGNAASAVQYVPEIAPDAAHLTVFQRTANWIMPRNQIIFTKEQLDGFEAHPETFTASRTHLHDFRESGFPRTQSGTSEQAEGIRIALEHLEKQVQNPELRAKLTPDYEFGCKRILRSDDFLPALCRDNVSLETRAISGFTSEGLRLADGTELPFDVVIFGTGFSSQAFHGDLQVTGNSGATLSEVWADGAEAYLGMSVPNFPNMFMIYGPNTNLNHNSIITMLEIQQDYIINVINEIGDKCVSVKPEIFNAFNDKVQADMGTSAFSSGCSSWYKNAAGKVINNWSGKVEDYRKVATWQPSDFEQA